MERENKSAICAGEVEVSEAKKEVGIRSGVGKVGRHQTVIDQLELAPLDNKVGTCTSQVWKVESGRWKVQKVVEAWKAGTLALPVSRQHRHVGGDQRSPQSNRTKQDALLPFAQSAVFSTSVKCTSPSEPWRGRQTRQSCLPVGARHNDRCGRCLRISIIRVIILTEPAPVDRIGGRAV